MKNLCILGSTGSIGTQTLDVVRNNKDKFNVIALASNSNIGLLKNQIEEFSPKIVCVYDENKAKELKEITNVKVVSKMEGLREICVIDEVDIVVTALVGMIGLLPTMDAISSKKTIALANKETLVTAGELVIKHAKDNNVDIIPVDSEHSAIFQCLNGENKKELKKILLTASGGAFRGMKKENLINATKDMALKHPNWSMGRKITIDSATLMNKGLEVIEAKWLFDVNAKDIDVLVHPQSIIHSMVEFKDNCVIAQLSNPDMRLPIQYALSYPKRLDLNVKSLDFFSIKELTFEKPNMDVFPCLKLAFEALSMKKTYTTVLNGANEVVVDAFLNDKIKFYDIPKFIEKTLENHTPIENPSLEDIIFVDDWSRKFVFNLIK